MERALLILLAAGALACAARGADGAGTGMPATRLDFAERSLREVSIRTLESMPPRFVLVLSREMPTPGYRFEVDSVEVDEQRKRIVARLTEIPPQGMVAQMIARTSFEIDVGTLQVGRYFVEIWSRRGAAADHRPIGATLVVASAPGR